MGVKSLAGDRDRVASNLVQRSGGAGVFQRQMAGECDRGASVAQLCPQLADAFGYQLKGHIDSATRQTPDPKLRQVVSNSPQSPEKASRVRSNSVTMPEPVARPARKRTSSGVFQVDESEPPPKKTEHVRSQSEGTRKEIKRPDASNGRRKALESTESENAKVKEKAKEKKKENVMNTFDSEAKTKCVSAFKESDSWD